VAFLERRHRNADLGEDLEGAGAKRPGKRDLGEVDPLLGRGGKGGRLTIPTEEGPILVQGIQDFVTMRGGAYFFMPGRRALRYLSGEATIAEDAWSYENVEASDDLSGLESMRGEERNFPDANRPWDDIH
jgi:hypothetical protein